MNEFTLQTPTQEAGLATAMEVVYQWNYDAEVEELRNLYVKAAEAQWIGGRDIEWERPIDLLKFSTTPLGAGIPMEKTSYWRSLPQDTVVELTRRTAAFRLSQFLHGEQGALMVAAQLVNAVPHTDAKFYAATQTMDEARHVEVFARYIEKLDEIRPIAPSLKGILDQTLETGEWMKKLVGMQIVVEGLALYAFREMRNLTAEPLLKDILTYVARDESRHHAYGVQYIERCVRRSGSIRSRCSTPSTTSATRSRAICRAGGGSARCRASSSRRSGAAGSSPSASRPTSTSSCATTSGRASRATTCRSSCSTCPSCLPTRRSGCSASCSRPAGVRAHDVQRRVPLRPHCVRGRRGDRAGRRV